MNQLTQKMPLKRIFIVLSILLLIIMPSLSRDFAQNGDEDVEITYGVDIWNYYLHGDKHAINYDNANSNLKGLEFYGGQFDVITEGVRRLVPGWHILDIRHFFAALFGALLIIFTGLLSYRLSNKNWGIAILASVFLFFSPRIMGESMNNGKDIPFAMAFVMGIYYLVRILLDFTLKKNLWKEALLLALAWGIAFGMRSAGGLLFVGTVGVVTIFYFILNKEKRAALFADKNLWLKKLALYFTTAFVLGYITGLLTWPFALQAPIDNLFVALKEMTNRSIGLRVLFEGKYYNSMAMPWYYELKWIFISNPVIVLLCALSFILLIIRAKKIFGSFTIFLLLFNALFPIFYIIYKNSTVYDTWRHVFFVYPFWVILAALSIPVIQSFLSEKLRLIPVAVVVIGLLPVVYWTISAHPNQYIYFNEFAGGTKGAFGNYDLDYYLTSSKQSSDWIMKNVPRPADGKKLRVLTNMEGLDNYFRNDTSWVYTNYCRYYERDQQDWDYYVTYGRFVSLDQLQNGKWPPANVVYSVNAGGVPVGIVIKRKSHDDYNAYQALQRKDYATAAQLYASYINVDNTNEMVYCNYAIALASTNRFDDAVQAMKKAIDLNRDQFQFYQILSQIYQAKGDVNSAQQILLEGQSRMAMQNEEMSE